MKNLRLRIRDLEILHYIATQKFATVSELYSLFWKSKKSSKYHYKRLYRLKEHGLIEPIESLINAMAGYTITSNGVHLLKLHGYEVTSCVFKKDTYTGTYRHDLLVNSLKVILLKSPLIKNFIPEHHIIKKLVKDLEVKKIAQNKDKIPDGIFTLWVQEKPQKVALEVELSLKSKRRYEVIFSKHLLSKNWETIFYIVKDEKMRKKLMDYLEEIKRINFVLKTEKKLNSIYFSLADEVLEKELEAIFMNQKISFSLKDLEKKIA